jgi:AcrR family transcriptional regulator
VTKPSGAGLEPLVPQPPGTNRRKQYSASTRRALIDVAEELFGENGYAATSLDAIVAGARVTKGALYHHFSGKQALFEAVFERVESDAAGAVATSLTAHRDPWTKARAGMGAFLEAVQEPRYRRIVIQEGPAVLGYERYREHEERSTFANVLDIVRAVLGPVPREVDEDLLQTFARILFGAISAAGEAVSRAPDPVTATERVQSAIGVIVAGLRLFADDGGQPATGEARRPLLLEGDVAAGSGDQLDPGAPGGDGQLPGPGGQLQG